MYINKKIKNKPYDKNNSVGRKTKKKMMINKMYIHENLQANQ